MNKKLGIFYICKNLRIFKMNKKGFIGPIGDDLPSLIPIVVGLLIFFTVFTNTLMIYDSKNAEIRQQIDMASIARTIKGDSLILSHDQFSDACDKTKLRRNTYNYMVGIFSTKEFEDITNSSTIVKEFIDSSSGYPDNISESFLIDEEIDESYFCQYRKAGSFAFSSKQAEYLIRFYPVAVQIKKEVGNTDYYITEPAIMGMVIWG